MSFDVNSTFGSSLIIGDYGTGKTYGVANVVYEAKDKNPDDICLISNIPRSITDIHYNSPEDLKSLISWLFRFFIESNNNIEKYNKTFRDIIIVIDEIHNYFPQDGTVLSGDKECMSMMRVILTQCRKRNVKFYGCSQRGKTVNINIRRYSDYVYMYDMQYYFDNHKFKRNMMHIYKCGGGISDLLGEDGVTWSDFSSLEKDRLDTLTMEYNTFLLQSAYKLKHYNWNLWKEKHLTQYICGLPGDFLTIGSYEEFKERLVFGGLEDDRKFMQRYNDDGIPLFVCDSYFYANRQERERQRFTSF